MTYQNKTIIALQAMVDVFKCQASDSTQLLAITMAEKALAEPIGDNDILLCGIIDDWEDKIVPWTSKRYLLNDFEIGDHVAVETFIQGPNKFAVKLATGIQWFDDADKAEKAALKAKPNI